MLIRKSLPVPARFAELVEFATAWRELDAACRPSRCRMFDLELAALLLVALRSTGPDWPAERYAALAGLLRELRK